MIRHRQLGAFVILVGLLSSCGEPAFTSAMRASGLPPTGPVETKCISTDYPYSDSTLDSLSKTMTEGGYRLVYVSHYTSSKIPGYPSIFCFERMRPGSRY